MTDLERQPIYKNAYSLLGQIIQLSRDLDRSFYDPFGIKILTLSYDIVKILKIRNDATDQKQVLMSIEKDLQELDFILEIMRDNRLIQVKDYIKCKVLISSVSKTY